MALSTDKKYLRTRSPVHALAGPRVWPRRAQGDKADSSSYGDARHRLCQQILSCGAAKLISYAPHGILLTLLMFIAV